MECKYIVDIQGVHKLSETEMSLVWFEFVDSDNLFVIQALVHESSQILAQIWCCLIYVAFKTCFCMKDISSDLLLLSSSRIKCLIISHV